jgi:hypothetical protein
MKEKKDLKVTTDGKTYTYKDNSLNISLNEQSRTMLDEIKEMIGAASYSEAIRSIIWNAHKEMDKK